MRVRLRSLIANALKFKTVPRTDRTVPIQNYINSVHERISMCDIMRREYNETSYNSHDV